MLKSLFWIIFVSSLFNSLSIYGQTIEISEPRLEMRGNIIHISYDILNSTRSDQFTVELVVKDEDGRIFSANALTGDIGDVVSGGRDKHIAWDLEADQIEINADIYVKIYVKAIPPPNPALVVEGVENNDQHEAEVIEKSDKADFDTKQFSRTGLILQSVAFPGLGLSRYKGGMHWIRGGIGYGCLVGSILMNQVAVNTYEGIIDQAGYDAKNTVYQKALMQDQISKIMAYSAIVIWASDLVWTILGTSDMGNRSSYEKGLRINSTFDPVSKTPLLAFTYNF